MYMHVCDTYVGICERLIEGELWFFDIFTYMYIRIHTCNSCLIFCVRLTTKLALGPECLHYSMYCTPSVQHKVPFAVAILV